VDWTKRFDMDVWYVENRSVLLDLRILIKTVQVVLKRDGISKEGHATMTRFTGSEPIRYERQKAA
ncbi:MAG: sugar transferase, partial [Anaerolineae bacterium]|nr:sugar transferase [Anaerolineae bacterium]